MCATCDAKNALKAAIKNLGSHELQDIALKFEGFLAFVHEGRFASSNEEDSRLKACMYSLAASLAQGYLLTTEDLIRSAFAIPNDSHVELRSNTIEAVISLWKEFGNRLPWAFYGGYAFMAARPNPEIPERLPELKAMLPASLPWECIDAVWHGLPPSTTLYMHVLATFCRYTGRIPLHGCGCNHYLPPIKQDDRWKLEVPMITDPKVLIIETEVPVAHFLASILNLALGVPHAFGESEKSLQAHAATGEGQEQEAVAELK